MKVSVIIPAYNAEQYITECIQSVVTQTYGDIEILIINDGSTDGTKRKAQILKKDDSRINIIDQSNKGIIAARSSGLLKSTGEVVLFLDADDFLLPDAVDLLVSKMNETGADMIIGNHFRLENGNKKAVQNILPKTGEDGKAIRYMLLGKFTAYMWGKLFKKELFNGIEIPNQLTYAEDMLTILSIFCKNSVHLAMVTTPIQCYRVHPGNISKTTNPEYVENIMTTARYVKTILKEHGLVANYLASYDANLCRNWVVYCRREGGDSKDILKRWRFFIKHFRIFSDGIPAYQKLELFIYTLHPYLGLHSTKSMKWIRNAL